MADLRDRLNRCWPKGLTASPPKREIILTPLNETYKGLNRLRKKASFHVDFLKGFPQGLKPTLILLHLRPD